MCSFNTEKESAESVVVFMIKKKKKVKKTFLKKETRQIHLDLHF